MKERFMNSWFARMYLWMTKAKYTMGLFYAFYTLIYLFVGWLAARPAVTMDFATSIEMMFACFFIGVAQQAILPVEKLSPARCALWIGCGSAVTLVFSLVFRWFAPFAPWVLPVFVLAMALGMGAMLLSYYLELRRETQLLNRHLNQFQHSRRAGSHEEE